ncbi:MAG: hypothetical protein JST86_19495 [Bacteroidetes bacterium]|nr:hypothetical protein [Bacteroidota bacterium]
MVNPDFTEIAQVGVMYTEAWLQENEYSNIEVAYWQPGSAEIKADGNVENLFIRVHTFDGQAERKVLNGTDRFAIADMARRLQRVPYVAYIVVNDDRDIVGDIVWERLV